MKFEVNIKVDETLRKKTSNILMWIFFHQLNEFLEFKKLQTKFVTCYTDFNFHSINVRKIAEKLKAIPTRLLSGNLTSYNEFLANLIL